jgi:hypothetical protein
MTLLTLLILLYFTNRGFLGTMGLKTLSFAKARKLLRVHPPPFNIFNWLLMVL